jgi:hypothetical protein
MIIIMSAAIKVIIIRNAKKNNKTQNKSKTHTIAINNNP